MIYKYGFVKVREGLRKKNPEKVIQRINLSLILESCENPTFLKTFAHTVSLLTFFLNDPVGFPPIFPFSLEHIVIIFGQGLPVRA